MGLVKQVPAGRLMNHRAQASRIAGDLRQAVGLPRGTVAVRCPLCGIKVYELDLGYVGGEPAEHFCQRCLALPENVVLAGLDNIAANGL